MQQQNRDLLWYAKELGLSHLAAQVADVLKMASHQGWSLEQTLQTLLEGEYERRLVGRQKARIKTAGFSQLKYLEQLDRNELPEGIKQLLPRLETLDFIHEHRNVVLYGNPGTGKTHVATALAIKACMEGMHVLFTSVPHLITQIKECNLQRLCTSWKGVLRNMTLSFVTSSGMSHVTRRLESYSSTTSRSGLTPSLPSLRQTSLLIDGEKS